MSVNSGKSKKDKRRHGQTPQHVLDQLVAGYQQDGRESWDEAWKLIHSTNWRKVAGVDLEAGVVYAQHIRDLGKFFMLQGYVEASAEFVFHNTVLTLVESHKWNPMILEAQILQVVDANTDIAYTITADAAGGLITGRDFVGVRHWETRDGIILSSGRSVIHPDCPLNKKHVRGETKGGGWYYKPIADNANRCIYGWIINLDLKGWIPQYLVDQAIAGTSLEYLRNLRLHIESIKPAVKTHSTFASKNGAT